jgi:prolyl 4-hydroxylase
MKQDVARYIENPLHGFGMIKRATADLSLLMERIPKEKAVVLEAHRIHETSLVHAVKCLLLLQRIYKLPTRDIARGIIHNRRVGSKMTPHDLFVIGNVASNLTNEEFFAKEYFELALEKKRDGSDNKLNEINELDLLLKVAQLCERMHDYRSAGLHLKQLMLSDTSNVEVAQYALRIVKMFQEHGNAKLKIDHPYNVAARDERTDRFSSRQEFSLMSDVCSGKLNRNEAQTNLHCRYFSTNAFSKIMPFRVEVVNAYPYILLYHDVLSEAEIQSLKTFVRQQKANEKSIRDVIRMRAMYDKDNKAIARISRRIEVSKLVCEVKKRFSTKKSSLQIFS